MPTKVSHIWPTNTVRVEILGFYHLPTDSFKGPIFKLSFFGADRYFISSVELLSEICDEKRFAKIVAGPLEQVRNGAGSGLFTAYHGEHDWGVAHRTLVPAFGPIGIHDMCMILLS
jgi:cytochrome P450/NADPH-cytochrome P450 reductase